MRGQLYVLVAVPPVPLNMRWGEGGIGMIWALGKEENLLPLLGIKRHSWMSNPLVSHYNECCRQYSIRIPSLSLIKLVNELAHSLYSCFMIICALTAVYQFCFTVAFTRK